MQYTHWKYNPGQAVPYIVGISKVSSYWLPVLRNVSASSRQHLYIILQWFGEQLREHLQSCSSYQITESW